METRRRGWIWGVAAVAVGLAVAIAYLASFGPWVAWRYYGNTAQTPAAVLTAGDAFYRPAWWLKKQGRPSWVFERFSRYVDGCVPEHLRKVNPPAQHR